MGNLVYQSILGMNVAVVSTARVVELVREWSEFHRGRYICVANVHMCMESFDDHGFQSVVNSADLAVPDGLPLVWAQRWLGSQQATQVRGEDLMRAICTLAEARQIPVGLFGGEEHMLVKLNRELLRRFPGLRIQYAFSPPFRPITDDEDRSYVDQINASGIRILFVGLGCPKQERWMAAHRDRLSVVMIGVGAAYDFIAGSKKPAPRWMQRIGLEWLFRLAAEPRRLWKRYLKQNPRFVWHFVKESLASSRTGNY